MSNLKNRIANIYCALRDRPNLAAAYYAIRFGLCGVVAATLASIVIEFAPAGFFKWTTQDMDNGAGYGDFFSFALPFFVMSVGAVALAGLCIGFADWALWRRSGVRLRDIAEELSANPIDYIRRARLFGNLEGREQLIYAGYPLKTKRKCWKSPRGLTFATSCASILTTRATLRRGR